MKDNWWDIVPGDFVEDSKTILMVVKLNNDLEASRGFWTIEYAKAGFVRANYFSDISSGEFEYDEKHIIPTREMCINFISNIFEGSFVDYWDKDFVL